MHTGIRDAGAEEAAFRPYDGEPAEEFRSNAGGTQEELNITSGNSWRIW